MRLTYLSSFLLMGLRLLALQHVSQSSTCPIGFLALGDACYSNSPLFQPAAQVLRFVTFEASPIKACFVRTTGLASSWFPMSSQRDRRARSRSRDDSSQSRHRQRRRSGHHDRGNDRQSRKGKDFQRSHGDRARDSGREPLPRRNAHARPAAAQLPAPVRGVAQRKDGPSERSGRPMNKLPTPQAGAYSSAEESDSHDYPSPSHGSIGSRNSSPGKESDSAGSDVWVEDTTPEGVLFKLNLRTLETQWVEKPKSKEWEQIALPDGRPAWLHKPTKKISTTAPEGQEAMGTAATASPKASGQSPPAKAVVQSASKEKVPKRLQELERLQSEAAE